MRGHEPRRQHGAARLEAAGLEIPRPTPAGPSSADAAARAASSILTARLITLPVVGHNGVVGTEPLPTPDRSALVTRLERAFPEGARGGIVSVYLFGSHAEGRAHRESDVDVAVLLRHVRYPTAAARFDERLRLSGILQAALGTRAVDVVVLNDVPPQFGRRIVTTGLRLICTDLEADHAFVRDVQLRAADLEPFLRRMRRLKLDAIAP